MTTTPPASSPLVAYDCVDTTSASPNPAAFSVVVMLATVWVTCASTGSARVLVTGSCPAMPETYRVSPAHTAGE